MNFNMDAAAEKFRDIAAAMGIDVVGLTVRQAAEKMVANLFSLLKDLNIESSLKDRGVTETELDLMVEAAAKVTRLLDNNPKPMTRDDMRAIYRKLL
jgi:alcohol dehydrogenase class IV